jgi:hydroxymethylglutaryl-CoA reductase
MTSDRQPNSRVPGFYRQSIEERLKALHRTGLLSDASKAFLGSGGGLHTKTADLFSENVVSVQGLPFSVALNFVVNGKDKLIAMAVEEPSVVAAASNAARMIRSCGGFTGVASASLMTGQIQLDEIADTTLAEESILRNKDEILALGDRSIPKMVARGGGCRDLEVRVLDEVNGWLVVHIYVDVGNAMGANMVDTVAEAVAPMIHNLTGGQLGLRILSNLATKRTAKVTAKVDAAALGSPELLESIARASRFAELDPYRAVTHNKGIMNGIDAAAVALGQDWRALEAGAHGFAALSGQIKPLATWKIKEDKFLHGEIELPLAVATVGGLSQMHPGVKAALELLDVSDAQELAVVLASCGLASNLAALRALAGEGIQKGHMRLHERRNVDANKA